MSASASPLVDISASRAALQGRASGILSRARWASEAFRRYGRSRVREIAEAVSEAGYRDAAFFAEWAVRETGFGIAEHKCIKNEMTSRALFEHYRDADFVTPKVDEAARIVRLPRPAGVVFALAPSTNPIATVNFKVLIAMLTRNAIVLSPHPAARECSAEAARRLADAAQLARGAPDGCIQVIENPGIPLVEEFLRSPETDVILATGGTAMVRSAYASSNPAIGVGPGNAPAYVGESADLRAAARRIIESKAFDNSILCTNESVVLAPERIAPGLVRELERAGAKLCDAEQAARLRRFLFDGERFNVEAIGRDATWIAAQAEITGVGTGARVLLVPLAGIGPEEPLSREKLCPVLGLRIVRDARQGIRDARALLRFAGAGHSAAIHSEDRQEIIDYASAVEAYRVVVNAPCSQVRPGSAPVSPRPSRSAPGISGGVPSVTTSGRSTWCTGRRSRTARPRRGDGRLPVAAARPAGTAAEGAGGRGSRRVPAGAEGRDRRRHPRADPAPRGGRAAGHPQGARAKWLNSAHSCSSTVSRCRR